MIDESSASFFSTTGSWLKAGAEVSLSIVITGNSGTPVATLFNGARTAVATRTSSGYSFDYTIQPDDDGPVVFTVQALDDAGNSAKAIMSSAHVAGKTSLEFRMLLRGHVSTVITSRPMETRICVQTTRHQRLR